MYKILENVPSNNVKEKETKNSSSCPLSGFKLQWMDCLATKLVYCQYMSCSEVDFSQQNLPASPFFCLHSQLTLWVYIVIK